MVGASHAALAWPSPIWFENAFGGRHRNSQRIESLSLPSAAQSTLMGKPSRIWRRAPGKTEYVALAWAGTCHLDESLAGNSDFKNSQRVGHAERGHEARCLCQRHADAYVNTEIDSASRRSVATKGLPKRASEVVVDSDAGPGAVLPARAVAS